MDIRLNTGVRREKTASSRAGLININNASVRSSLKSSYIPVRN